MPHLPALLLVLLLATVAGWAHAARPMQTEDAPAMAPQACELESADTRLSGSGESSRRTYLQLGCGIGWHTELALQAATHRELVLGGKTRVAAVPWQGGEAEFSLAWNLARHRADDAWHRSSAGLLLAVTAPLTRDWTVHGNLGHLRDEVLQRRSMTWALGVEHNGLGGEGRWQPMLEMFGDDHGRRWANAALRVGLVRDQLYVDGSLGRQLGGQRSRLVTLGLLLAF